MTSVDRFGFSLRLKTRDSKGRVSTSFVRSSPHRRPGRFSSKWSGGLH